MLIRLSVILLTTAITSVAFAENGMGPTTFPPPPRKSVEKKETKSTLKKVEIVPPKTVPTESLTPSVSEPAADSQKSSLSGVTFDDTGTVVPEVSTAVRFSNSDVNRITCSTEIKDVVWSDEKPVKVKWVDKEVFVKFQPLQRDTDGKLFYTTDPIDLYVSCGDSIYTIIAVPYNLPMQTIRLVSRPQKNIKQNNELYGGMPFERKIMSFVRSVYTDDLPDSFAVKKYDSKINVFREIDLTLKKVVRIEGEGLLIKEYLVSMTDQFRLRMELDERMFLNSEVANRAVGISVIPPTLIKGSVSRLLVVEQSKEAGR